MVLPLLRLFQPGIVLVSAGFDAAPGHPPTLGGYTVSPACFAFMTRSLVQAGEGRLVLALEGGYTGPAVAEAVQGCLAALLSWTSPAFPATAEISRAELERRPAAQAVEDLRKTIAMQVRGTFDDNWIRVTNVLVLCTCRLSGGPSWRTASPGSPAPSSSSSTLTR